MPATDFDARLNAKVVQQLDDSLILARDEFQDENFFPVEEGILLSGHGHQTGEDCGRPVATFWSGQEWRFVRHSCGKQGCPVCFRRWASATADRAAGYLWAMKDITVSTAEHVDAVGHLYHCVFALEPGASDENFIKNIMSFMATFHVGKSELGAMFVYHPAHLVCSSCGQAAQERGVAGMSVATACSCGAELPWIWAEFKHYHVITNFYCRDFVGMVRAEGAFHFHFSNISDTKKKPGKKCKRYIESREELLGIISYELGHAEWKPGKVYLDYDPVNAVKIDGEWYEVEGVYQLTKSEGAALPVRWEGENLVWDFSTVMFTGDIAKSGHAVTYFGLFNQKRWYKRTDVPEYKKEIVLDSIGNPFFKVSAFSLGEDVRVPLPVKFISEAEEGDEVVEVNGEQRILLVVKRYAPVLALAKDAFGRDIPRPPVGTWTRMYDPEGFSENRDKRDRESEPFLDNFSDLSNWSEAEEG